MSRTNDDGDTALLEPALYETRFSHADTTRLRSLWRPIVGYLQRYVDEQGTTLDLGAGSCHFINFVRSKRRIAIDINARNLQTYACAGVECVVGSAADLNGIAAHTVNTAVASNVYEHFMTREDVSRSLSEVFRVLVPGGRCIILQPNFRYCMKRYYDFFDHRLAFTHEAMKEALQAVGFTLERVTAQFLPYTTKSMLPQSEALVRLYLAMPLMWRLLGGQMLIIARKAPAGGSLAS